MLIGKTNRLRAIRFAKHGAYLTDGETDVLLPVRYVDPKLREGDEVDVFVYADSEDRLIATTQRPRAEVGQFAAMRAISVGPVGAFMDWGLEKDLLVPFAQQFQPIREGSAYVVRVLLDERTSRIVGSTKITKFLNDDMSSLGPRASVHALVYRKIPAGAMVVADGLYNALIPRSEMYEELRVGDSLTAFVKRVRPDGRGALSTTPQGLPSLEEEGTDILRMLEQNGGFLPFSDSSDPADIRRAFGLSKSSFKKLIGMLYREGKIDIEHFGIRLKA